MIPTREMVHVASAPVQLNVAIVLDPRSVSKAFSKHSAVCDSMVGNAPSSVIDGLV